MGRSKEHAFLGQGWAFPIHIDSDGKLGLAAHDDDVRQAILIILRTTPGERMMRPDFGSGLQALAFEPMNTTTMALAKLRVEQALVAWEPRIDNVAVDVVPQVSEGRLDIQVHYRVRRTNTFYNLVYPFYLSEGATL